MAKLTACLRRCGHRRRQPICQKEIPGGPAQSSGRIAAGGIADGRGLAAALALGAQAPGSAPVFSPAGRQPSIRYRELVLKARETEELFDIGWPNAPHRVLRNKTVEAWEAAGCLPSGKRPGREK